MLLRGRNQAAPRDINNKKGTGLFSYKKKKKNYKANYYSIIKLDGKNIYSAM